MHLEVLAFNAAAWIDALYVIKCGGWQGPIHALLCLFSGMSKVSVEAESRKAPGQDMQMGSSMEAENTEDFRRESKEDAHSFDCTDYVLNNDEVPHDDRAENDSDVQNDNNNAEDSDGAQNDNVQSDNEIKQNSVNAEHDDDDPNTSGNAHSDNAGAKKENCHTVTTDNDTPKKNEDSHTHTKVTYLSSMQTTALGIIHSSTLVHVAICHKNMDSVTP